MFVELIPVTPFKTFNSVSVEVTVDNLLICAELAVTGDPPKVNDVADKLPVTDNGLLAVMSFTVKVRTEAPCLCPMLEPSTNILSTATAPAVTVLVLAKVISPNPSTIEPATKAPVVNKDVVPAIGA